MTMTDERLAKLDAVMAKAVAGEWQKNCSHIYGPEPARVLIAQCLYPNGGRTDEATAIVALHNAYPDLRALIEAQAATIARQAEALREAQGWFAEYAVMHLDKNTPEGVAKAASNARKAEYCAAALTGAA